MKTAELTGDALDYWIAMAEGETPFYDRPAPFEIESGEAYRWLKQGQYGSSKKTPRYSRDWADGGPIIEREKMNVAHVDDGHGIGWVAYMPAIHHGFGATPLIAAMRAYVASKYGDEVPDALQSGVSPTSKTAT